MMNVSYVRLIGEKREDLGNDLPAQTDNVPFLRERRGEKIVALDASTREILGWIGIYPDRDEGGAFFHLTGIEVRPQFRGRGIGSDLMAEAAEYIQARKATRLRFGTSPLLTENAGLYITRFGTRYRWKEGVRTPDGLPWPFVSCECDFDDPIARSLDLRDEDVRSRSVLDWDGQTPVPRQNIQYRGPLAVVLPEITSDHLAQIAEQKPEVLRTLYAVFHALHLHGYEFAWFDRLPAEGTRDAPPFFCYVMTRVVAF